MKVQHVIVFSTWRKKPVTNKQSHSENSAGSYCWTSLEWCPQRNTEWLRRPSRARPAPELRLQFRENTTSTNKYWFCFHHQKNEEVTHGNCSRTREDVHLVQELQFLRQIPVTQHTWNTTGSFSFNPFNDIVIELDKLSVLLDSPRPLMNSRKLMRASPFSSRRRKKRAASGSEWAPFAQEKSTLNRPLNCSTSMRYCSR